MRKHTNVEFTGFWEERGAKNKKEVQTERGERRGRGVGRLVGWSVGQSVNQKVTRLWLLEFDQIHPV